MPEHLAIYAASKAAVCHYCEAIAPRLREHAIGTSILLLGPVASNIHEAGATAPRTRAPSGATRPARSGWPGASSAMTGCSRRRWANCWPKASSRTGCIWSPTAYTAPAMIARSEALLAAVPDCTEPLPDFTRLRD